MVLSLILPVGYEGLNKKVCELNDKIVSFYGNMDHAMISYNSTFADSSGRLRWNSFVSWTWCESSCLKFEALRISKAPKVTKYNANGNILIMGDLNAHINCNERFYTKWFRWCSR